MSERGDVEQAPGFGSRLLSWWVQVPQEHQVQAIIDMFLSPSVLIGKLSGPSEFQAA